MKSEETIRHKMALTQDNLVRFDNKSIDSEDPANVNESIPKQ
jgi:hypothetical protein